MGKRYIKQVLKQYAPLSVPFVILIVASLWIGNMYKTDGSRESTLAHSLYSFTVDGGDWEVPVNPPYPAGSAEEVFLKGMELFIQEDYEQAQQLFHKSLIQPRTDASIPIYAYYYINECNIKLTGRGSVSAVTNALSFMAKYEPLANNMDFLWNILQTIVFSDREYENAVAVMETYLNRAKSLNIHSQAWLMNSMAMLEYNGAEYVQSIRRFYDVEILLSNNSQVLTSELKFELLFAREYIANIKFLLEDYEGAIVLYTRLIGNEIIQDNFTNYIAYINLADSYLRLGRPQEALSTIRQLQNHVSEIQEECSKEIEANIHDILANIFMLEGNLYQAQLHLQQTAAYYQGENDTILFNGRQAAIITRCKYLRQSGQISEAQALLQELLQQKDKFQMDFRRDILLLLSEIYKETNQEEKLTPIYQELLEIDKEFIKILQNAYLEFSEYYRENNYLRQDNSRLKQGNLMAILGIVIISSWLIIILILFRLLSTKNITDQLTGIYNRKKLMQLLRTYRRKGTPEAFGVIMLDIDYFKLYNDTYGHVKGDAVLKQVAHMLTESVRSNDIVIRYGGEEFLVLLNNVTAVVAQSVCQRIHQQLDTLHLPHKASKVSDHVTISMGLCHQQDQNTFTMDKLIQQADTSLYKSKEAGRNRTTLWSPT